MYLNIRDTYFIAVNVYWSTSMSKDIGLHRNTWSPEKLLREYMNTHHVLLCKCFFRDYERWALLKGLQNKFIKQYNKPKCDTPKRFEMETKPLSSKHCISMLACSIVPKNQWKLHSLPSSNGHLSPPPLTKSTTLLVDRTERHLPVGKSKHITNRLIQDLKNWQIWFCKKIMLYV